MFNAFSRFFGRGAVKAAPEVAAPENKPANTQATPAVPAPSTPPRIEVPARSMPVFQIIDPSAEFQFAGKSLSFNKYVMDFINDAGYGSQPNPYTEQQLLTAYLSSVYLYAALRRVSNLISRVRVVAEVKQGDQYVRLPETALINRIFERDGASIFSRGYLNYAIFGSCVILKLKTYKAVLEQNRGTPIYDYKDGAVSGLYNLDKPMWELDEDTYSATINGIFVHQANQHVGDRNYISRNEFIYITDWNPQNPNRGRSIATVAIHEAVTNASIARWSSEYFTRGAMPFIMVSMEDDPTLMSDADLLKYKRQFEDHWQGVSSSLRSVFFDRKVNIEQVGIPAGELGAPELNTAALEGISAAVGLDRELIVTPEGGSQERHSILVKRAWEDTIIPTAEMMLREIAEQLGLPEGMRLVLDLSHIKELEAERNDAASTETSIFDAGLQTFNEARVRLNMQPIKELDGWFKQNGELMSLKRIIRQDNLIDDKLMQQIGQLWEADLMKRSQILAMLGQKLPEGEVDGYKTEVSNAMQLEMERQTKLLEFSFDREILELKAQLEAKLKGTNPTDGGDDDPGGGAAVASDDNPTPDSGGGSAVFAPNAYVSSGGRIYMRALPRPDSIPVSIVSPDAPVQMVARSEDGSWVRVYDSAGKLGWLRAGAVDSTQDKARLPVYKPAQRRTPQLPAPAVTVNFNTPLKLRRLPTPERNWSGGVLMPGEKVQIIYQSANRVWSKVRGESGATGWMYTALLDGAGDPVLNADETAAQEYRIMAETETPADDELLLELPEESPETAWNRVETAPTDTLLQDDDSSMLEDGDPLYDEIALDIVEGDDDVKVDAEIEVSPLPTPQIEMAWEKWATKESEDDTVSPPELSIPSEAFASLSLPNHPDLLRAQESLRQQLGDDPDIQWTEPENFHVTLLYAPSIDDEGLARVIELLPSEFEALELRVGDLLVFENGYETVFALEVDGGNALRQLQQRVYSAFSAQPIPISNYSNPGVYNPHITMCYVPTGTPVPTYSGVTLVINPAEAVIQRDNYQTVHTIPFKARQDADELGILAVKSVRTRARQGTIRDELAAWENKTVNKGIRKGLAFETILIPKDKADEIRSALKALEPHDMQGIRAVFARAKEWDLHGLQDD